MSETGGKDGGANRLSWIYSAVLALAIAGACAGSAQLAQATQGACDAISAPTRMRHTTSCVQTKGICMP